MSRSDDVRFMTQALDQARRGSGSTWPNPAVGAVVVARGRVIARGYHHRAGAPHAEIEAIRSARGSLVGATLYVTLEPCCHHGRTGPCTASVIAERFARVVVGCRDPNPIVAGKGVALLRRAGIEVLVGMEQKACRELIAGYSKHVLTGRPLVILKAATSVDGRLATRTGDSLGLTGSEALAHLHEVRAASDAILVGIRTVLADNPRLTARGTRSGRSLVRVVVDSTARTPCRARVVTGPGRIIVAVGPTAPPGRLRRLEKSGVEILRCRAHAGQVSLADLIRRLGQLGLTSVLVEGGGRIHGSLLRGRLADRSLIYIAPRLIGGDGVALAAGTGVREVSATGLVDPVWQQLGKDMLLSARFRHGWTHPD